MEPFPYFSVSDQNPWPFSYSSSDDGHFLAAFANCKVAAARAKNGLCFHALACILDTPTGLMEVGALPLPHDAQSPGVVPAGGTTPPSPRPTPFCFSFAAFLINCNSCFLNFGVCLVFIILKSETH